MVLAIPVAIVLAVALVLMARRRSSSAKRTMAHNVALQEALARASDAAKDERRGLDIGSSPDVA